MGLKLRELQNIVKNVVKEEKNVEAFREEIVKALGPTVLTSYGLERMAESANERLDILYATGRSHGQIKPSLLLKFASSESPEVRKLVARLIPENFLKTFMKDSHPAVRYVVANRLPYALVKEMTNRFPKDDSLFQVLTAKRILEAGLPDPDVEDEEFDMYGEESMREMIKDVEHPGLTDAWYETLGRKIVNFYGDNIEGQWEEIAVKRHCDSMRSMGVEVDREKLLDIVNDIIMTSKDEALEEGLNSLAERLLLEEAVFMPVISEMTDPVIDLVNSRSTAREYIEKFEKLFSVQKQETYNPSYAALLEGHEHVTCPVKAEIPRGFARSVDEKAIDMYVSTWNKKQQLSGESYSELKWTPDPAAGNLVNFHLELK